MSFELGHVPAHKGRITTTRPIADLEDIAAIKSAIYDNKRDYAMFCFAINTGLRASDIVQLERTDLETLDDGRITFILREQKTRKVRRITLNEPTTEALQRYLNDSEGRYVFMSQRGQITTAHYGRLTKDWVRLAGLSSKNIASHSLRKTFVRVHLEHHKADLLTMQWLLNHSDPRQTLVYAGLTPDDAATIYSTAI